MKQNKRFILTLCFLLCLSLTSFSQQLLIPYRDGKRWGFADTSGTLRIQPAYDKVDFFDPNTNTAEVFQNKKISLIDESGKQLIPFSDDYNRFRNTYIITQQHKKGMYSAQNTQLLPVEYNSIECACYYDKYRKDTGKVIAIKNNKYYLVTLRTMESKEVPSPFQHPPTSFEGVTMVPFNRDDITSVPNPQFRSTEFPRLFGYNNLVHCKTLYKKMKPVFYVFCAWKDNQNLGYVGQNGVIFYKD